MVGTALFLISLGLYELFIQPLPLPPGLKTHNIQELELNLVGLTIVVLAVNFLSVIFEEQEINLAVYGIVYALPITSLAYFMKVRSQIKGNETENRTDRDEDPQTSDNFGIWFNEPVSWERNLGGLYFSETRLNNDNFPHIIVAKVTLPSGIKYIIMAEGWYGGGDKDYNEMIVRLTLISSPDVSPDVRDDTLHTE